MPTIGARSAAVHTCVAGAVCVLGPCRARSDCGNMALMQYLGGKSRLGGQIVRAILQDLGRERLGVVADLCAGAGGVTHRLADVSERVIAVEAHPGLVALHKAVQGGWVPPEHVSEEEWREARYSTMVDDCVFSFRRFACGHGGDWMGGYARNRRGDNYAQAASRTLVRDRRSNVEHTCADALAWEGAVEVVYCDPPYEGTTGYAAVVAAEPGAWWRKLQALADRGVACYLSEYAEAPPEGVAARQVWSAPTHKTQLTKGTKTERLWRVLPSPPHTPPAEPPAPRWQT